MISTETNSDTGVLEGDGSIVDGMDAAVAWAKGNGTDIQSDNDGRTGGVYFRCGEDDLVIKVSAGDGRWRAVMSNSGAPAPLDSSAAPAAAPAPAPAPAAPRPTQSWAWFCTDSKGEPKDKWARNGLSFVSEAESDAYGLALGDRWWGMVDGESRLVDGPATYRFVDGKAERIEPLPEKFGGTLPSAPLSPKVIQGQEDEYEGDLCDTCMCSGVEISHTEGGKTVCVECAAGGSDLAPQEVQP